MFLFTLVIEHICRASGVNAIPLPGGRREGGREVGMKEERGLFPNIVRL
jgi:hypothetical protein